jgi:mRNA interferase MazF
MIAPGDIVLIDFPGVQGIESRPTVVGSTTAYQFVRPDLIVALFTSKVSKSNTPTDYALQDWSAAGLHVRTAYRSFFATLPIRSVHRSLGHVSDRDWLENQARLRLALAVI